MTPVPPAFRAPDLLTPRAMRDKDSIEIWRAIGLLMSLCAGCRGRRL